MDALDAAVVVLREAGEPLHWTVIQDRALRRGLLDPFADPNVRGRLLAALRDGVRAGAIEKIDTGVYTLAPAQGEPERG